jgi:endonuclease/exonuclease/phosphatase family metal-dependent hydrolase
MTYNIHLLLSAQGECNISKVVHDIMEIQPDVVVFQEIPMTQKWSLFDSQMKALDYQYEFHGGPTIECLANMVYSRIEMKHVYQESFSMNRCFISFVVNDILVLGTHLEVQDQSTRVKEMKRLIEYAHSQQSVYPKQMILADFNDWYDSPVLKYSRDNGFMDSFDTLQWERPNYTCWTGVSVDFILLKSIEISGSFVWHTTSSDHCPILVDVI